MKITQLASITLVAANNAGTCDRKRPVESRWECGEEQGIEVCNKKTCNHGVTYRKGCYCDEGDCSWTWLAPVPCMDPTQAPQAAAEQQSAETMLNDRRNLTKKPKGQKKPKKPKIRGKCNSFNAAAEGWHCTKDDFVRNTVCSKLCNNFGVAFKRCRCQRNSKIPCRWVRKTTNAKCFLPPVNPNPVRDNLNFALNGPLRPPTLGQGLGPGLTGGMPSAFLRDFVDAAEEIFDYDEEEATTTTASTTYTTTTDEKAVLKEPVKLTPPKNVPSQGSALQAAVNKAGKQINEWVDFLKELLHFDQLTVIAIDSGTLKDN